MEFVNAFLQAPEDATPASLITTLGAMRDYNALAAKMALYAGAHMDNESVVLSLLQNTNSLSLAPAGMHILAAHKVHTLLCVTGLQRHTRNISVCIEATYIIKNMCLEMDIKVSEGKGTIKALLAAFVAWYPPNAGHPFPIVAALAEALMVVTPPHVPEFRTLLLASLEGACYNLHSTEVVLSRLINPTMPSAVPEELVQIKDLKIILSAMKRFGKSALALSNGLFCVAHLLMSPAICEAITPKMMVKIMGIVVAGVRAYPTVAQVLLSAMKVLVSCKLFHFLRCLQECGSCECVLTALKADYVTEIAGYPQAGVMLPPHAPISEIKKWGLYVLCNQATEPRNRVDVPDTIIKALSEFQVNPDLLPAGLGIIVGEAVTAYTRDAPPETIAKFQAAMLEAMEDEEAKEEEEE